MERLSRFIPNNFLGFPTLFQDKILKQEVTIFCMVAVLLMVFYKIINKNIFVVSTINWLVVALLIFYFFYWCISKNLVARRVGNKRNGANWNGNKKSSTAKRRFAG